MTNELEYALTSALDIYLTTQFNAGRLDPSNLKRVAEAWRAKGRPRVVGFRYDLETQIELIRMHVQEFKFCGGLATKTAAMGILDMATTNARALRVRTFCQPDTVLAKWLLDAQSVLNMVGGREEEQWLVVEVTAYYKAAIERETLLAAEREQKELEQQQGERLRHVKSVSGEKWNKTTPGGGGRAGGSGQGVVRRTASFEGIRMDPTEYAEDQYI